MRSISTKLIIAFLSIGIISVAIIFITARLNTRAEFIRFLTDQTQNDNVTQLSDYYLAHGSWSGVETMIAPPQQNEGGGPGHRPPQLFTLSDENGIVITSNGQYHSGERLSEADLEAGTPITPLACPCASRLLIWFAGM